MVHNESRQRDRDVVCVFELCPIQGVGNNVLSKRVAKLIRDDSSEQFFHHAGLGYDRIGECFRSSMVCESKFFMVQAQLM